MGLQAAGESLEEHGLAGSGRADQQGQFTLGMMGDQPGVRSGVGSTSGKAGVMSMQVRECYP